MLNLEELDLNIIVGSYEKFIDGDTLKKDLLIYVPRLYKFTFNICSTINHRNQTNFPLNEHIEKTIEYFSKRVRVRVGEGVGEGAGVTEAEGKVRVWVAPDGDARHRPPDPGTQRKVAMQISHP